MRNIHNSTHNFSGGISLYAPSDYRSQIPIPVGVRGTANGWKSYYWDFAGAKHSWASDLNGVEYTETGAGATVAAAAAYAHGLTITLDGTDNDSVSLQHLTPQIVVARDKDFWMETRLETTKSTIIEAAWYVGLSSDQGTTKTDFIDEAATEFLADDMIGWGSPLAGNGFIDFFYHSGDVDQIVVTGQTQVTAVEVKLGMFYDSSDRTLQLYQDDVLIVNHNVQVLAWPTTTDPLGLHIYLENESAEASIMGVQYLSIAQEL